MSSMFGHTIDNRLIECKKSSTMHLAQKQCTLTAEPQALRIMTLFGSQETITSAMLIQNLWQKVSQDNVLIAM